MSGADIDRGSAASSRGFLPDFSGQAAIQGLIVAIVGYASSVAILIKGLAAVGASESQVASALLFVGLTKGIASILLSLRSRMPVSIAWTTPGMALLATTGAVAGGFGAAVGAFIIVGLLIVLAAFWGPLARLVAAIPKAIASAMLAGIILKLCLAPFVAIRELPATALAILAVWLVMLRFARLWAVPAAVVVALGAVSIQSGGFSGGLGLPRPEFVAPVFTIEAVLSIALPLFVVTMASQNITGLAVLSTFGFRHSAREGLFVTGVLSALSACFGAPAVNYAAITAALCAGSDAHPDPARRYVAAVFSGIGYISLAGLAAIAAALVLRASPVLIEAAAGLALIAAFGGAIKAATDDETERLPALLTFLVTASGLTAFGIGGAFWGLALGWGVREAFRLRG
jgi:benzoate membrane transport protein